jgi:hypothetical protein
VTATSLGSKSRWGRRIRTRLECAVVIESRVYAV